MVDPHRGRRADAGGPSGRRVACRAAAALERRDFEVAANDSASLDAATLGSADVLVIAHPSEPRWESTTGVGEPRLGAEEIEAIVSWVESGGGLIVLGETEQEKYGNNLNELLGRFGIEIENATVQDYEHHSGDAPSWILAEPRHRRGAAAPTRLPASARPASTGPARCRSPTAGGSSPVPIRALRRRMHRSPR